MIKNRRDEQDETYREFIAIIKEELERLPRNRRATPYEMRVAAQKASLRIGRKLSDAFALRATEAYVAGLNMAGQDLGRSFQLGGIHERALRTIIEGEAVASSFAGFHENTVRRFNSIIEEAYATGEVNPGTIVTTMIGEVGYESRKNLERIANTETWKVWETARMNAYEEYEEDLGEKLLYRFGTIDDYKTCQVCNNIMDRTQDGVPLEDLKAIIIEEAGVHNPKWDPVRDNNFPIPHPNCRHRFWRTQGPTRAIGKSADDLPLIIELKPGDKRTGTNKKGKRWEREMHLAYGRIRRTKGADGEELDFYLGPDRKSDFVLVVHQIDQDTKKFDEHKLMLGFHDRDDALAGYLAHYPTGWRVGPVKETTIEAVKEWIENGDTTRIMKAGTGGAYCDLMNDCFPTPQGLAAHVRATGHPVPNEQATQTPDYAVTDSHPAPIEQLLDQYLANVNMDEAVAKMKAFCTDDVIEEELTDLHTTIGHAIGDMLVENVHQDAENGSDVEDAMKQALRWSNPYSALRNAAPKSTMSSGTKKAIAGWSTSSMDYDTGPLWAWAAKRYNNPNVPSDVTSTVWNNPEDFRPPNQDEIEEFEYEAVMVQHAVRSMDPSYDPETDTVVLYRGVSDKIGDELINFKNSNRTVSREDTLNQLGEMTNIDTASYDINADKVIQSMMSGGWTDRLFDKELDNDGTIETVIRGMQNDPHNTGPDFIPTSQWDLIKEDLRQRWKDANGAKDEPKYLKASHRSVESWSSDPDVARNFGKAVIQARIPVSSIAQTFYTSAGKLYDNEAEYIVATPDGNAYYDASNIITPSVDEGSKKIRQLRDETKDAWKKKIGELSKDAFAKNYDVLLGDVRIKREAEERELQNLTAAKDDVEYYEERLQSADNPTDAAIFQEKLEAAQAKVAQLDPSSVQPHVNNKSITNADNEALQEMFISSITHGPIAPTSFTLASKEVNGKKLIDWYKEAEAETAANDGVGGDKFAAYLEAMTKLQGLGQ